MFRAFLPLFTSDRSSLAVSSISCHRSTRSRARRFWWNRRTGINRNFMDVLLRHIVSLRVPQPHVCLSETSPCKVQTLRVLLFRRRLRAVIYSSQHKMMVQMFWMPLQPACNSCVLAIASLRPRTAVAAGTVYIQQVPHIWLQHCRVAN